jgi:hypothetical protein
MSPAITATVNDTFMIHLRVDAKRAYTLPIGRNKTPSNPVKRKDRQDGKKWEEFFPAQPL